jgi:hypothetical protein
MKRKITGAVLMSLSLVFLATRWSQPHGPCWDACQKEYAQCVKSREGNADPGMKAKGLALCKKYLTECEAKCPQYGH